MRCTLVLALLLLLAACSNNDSLPVFGNKTTLQRQQNGQTVTDSVDYTIPPFELVDQDSNTVNLQTVSNKVYIADFFFTSCPSICPKMKKEMLRIYDKYQHDNNVVLLSHSIDPVRDSVPRLKAYCNKLGISNTGKWHLLTGPKDSIYRVAEGYLVSAHADTTAPGGYIHDGHFIMVDRHGRIRGYYDGTSEEKVTQLMADMEVLLKEK